MVSGMNPSMLRMRARTGRGRGVTVGSWATTGVTVAVSGWKGVAVRVETTVPVIAGSGVELADRPCAPRTWGRQEVRSRSARRKVRVRFIGQLDCNPSVVAQLVIKNSCTKKAPPNLAKPSAANIGMGLFPAGFNRQLITFWTISF